MRSPAVERLVVHCGAQLEAVVVRITGIGWSIRGAITRRAPSRKAGTVVRDAAVVRAARNPVGPRGLHTAKAVAASRIGKPPPEWSTRAGLPGPPGTAPEGETCAAMSAKRPIDWAEIGRTGSRGR